MVIFTSSFLNKQQKNVNTLDVGRQGNQVIGTINFVLEGTSTGRDSNAKRKSYAHEALIVGQAAQQ